MNALRRYRLFLRGIVFVAIIGSACVCHYVAELIAGSDAYYPADRVLRFIADALIVVGRDFGGWAVGVFFALLALPIAVALVETPFWIADRLEKRRITNPVR